MPVILLGVGGLLGSFVAGTHGGIWGSLIGFASGCGVLGGLLWAFERVRTR